MHVRKEQDLDPVPFTAMKADGGGGGLLRARHAPLKSRRTSATGDKRHNMKSQTEVDSLKDSQVAAGRDHLLRAGHHPRAQSKQESLKAEVRPEVHRSSPR